MNKRIVKIANLLLNNGDNYTTIERVAQALSVSNKTIRNDLVTIEVWFDKLGLTLEKTTGVGIRVQGDASLKLKANDQIKKLDVIEYADTPLARQHYILLTLCTNDFISVKQLTEVLYVSRASIHNDLHAIENYLSTTKISLNRVSNRGLSLIGSERSIRNLMFELIMQDSTINLFNVIITNKEYICNGDFIFLGLDLTDDEIKDFIDVSGIRELDMPINNLTQFAVRVLITWIRTANDYFINLSQDFMNELNNKPYLKQSIQLLTRLEKHFKINFSLNEAHYIQVYLLAFGETNDSLQSIEQLASALIASWESVLDLGLEEDEVLYENLLAHLLPTQTRIEHGIAFKNNLLEEIKQLYQKTFMIVGKSVQELNHPLWSKMSDSEIGLLTLHLAAAIERNKRPLRTLLINPEGFGARLLLINKISGAIREIDIVHEMNTKPNENDDLSNFDLIISTVKLNINSSQPVLVINNLVSDDDLSRLRKIVRDYYTLVNTPSKKA